MRTFKCKVCGGAWQTEALGNFQVCPSCKKAREDEKRAKTCSYCNTPFRDETERLVQDYCNVECRRRAKLVRAGKVPEGGFLADRSLTCPKCSQEFTPTRGKQVYCSDACRLETYAKEGDASRNKVCAETGEAFRDDSPKNNRQYLPEVSRARVGVKVDPEREPAISPRLVHRRKGQVRSGLGGRMDDIASLQKYTNSWWGRASEMIFAAYRPFARDMVIEFGNRSPYDFEDSELGRVEVRGLAAAESPQGRPMWAFATHGLRTSCDHAFFVGYDEDKNSVKYLWLIPAKELPEATLRLAPGSKEYRGDQWDITDSWGLMIATTVLRSLYALEDPERPEDRYVWLDDPKQFSNEDAPSHRGRKGEFLYKDLHPLSQDMNRELGPHALYDFLDPDGVRVNAKVSKGKTRGSLTKWSFCMGDSPGHACDVYSCLCLGGPDGKTVVAEYRIPVEAWGERRTIHIYSSGGQWEKFKA